MEIHLRNGEIYQMVVNGLIARGILPNGKFQYQGRLVATRTDDGDSQMDLTIRIFDEVESVTTPEETR